MDRGTQVVLILLLYLPPLSVVIPLVFGSKVTRCHIVELSRIPKECDFIVDESDKPPLLQYLGALHVTGIRLFTLYLCSVFSGKSRLCPGCTKHNIPLYNTGGL